MRLTLSPHIVLLVHVRTLNDVSLMNFHTVLSLIVLQNLVSGSRVNGFGICSRKLFDLNRYG